MDKTRAPEVKELGPLRFLTFGLLFGLVATPLLALLWRGARPGLLVETLTPEVAEATVNTLVTSGLGAALATVVGTILAWTVERTDLPARNLFRAAFLAPFLIPPFIGTIGWLAVFGPVGYVNDFYNDLTGSEEGLVDLYGPGGIIVLLAIFSYPIVYVVVAAALRRMPGALEDAARMGGAGRIFVLKDVTIPLVLPSVLAGFILTLVSNLSDFGVPALLGLPEQYQVLSTLVYSYLVGGTADNPIGSAAALGVLLLGLAGGAFFLQRAVARRTSFAVSGAPARRVSLGRARLPVTVALSLLAATISVAPIVALMIGSLLPAPGVAFTLENITLSNIADAVTSPSAVNGFYNSLFLSAGAALVAGILGACVATLATRSAGRGSSTLDTLALAPQALPGAVVAVAWILIAIPTGIYNTSFVILFAYVTAFLALVVQAARGPLASIPKPLERAARLCGASPFRVLTDVTWPLAAPAIAAGAILVFFTAIRELTISALLVSPGTQTLGVVIFNLQQAGAYNSSQALALIVALASLGGAGGVMIALGGRGIGGEN